ncbi:MAG: L-rhamnose mutarotase [Solirubrobacterales bacterium]
MIDPHHSPDSSNGLSDADSRRTGLGAVAGRANRACFTLRVRPARLPEYRRRHTEVWDGMLEALRKSGWRNYSLFLRPDGLLVGYFECDDCEEAMVSMERSSVNAEWRNEMRPFFEPRADGEPDVELLPVEEIFHLD